MSGPRHGHTLPNGSTPSGSLTIGNSDDTSTHASDPSTHPKKQRFIELARRFELSDAESFLDRLSRYADALVVDHSEMTERDAKDAIKLFARDPVLLKELNEVLSRNDYTMALSRVEASMLVHPIDIGWECLGDLWTLLWAKADTITHSESVKVPTIVPFPAEFNFKDTIDPPAGVVDLAHCVDFRFNRLRLPKESTACFPCGPDLFAKDMFVRPIYSELLQMIEAQPRHAIVLGQPRIGKTHFLVYILLQRLLRGEPTAIQLRHDVIWTFTEHGFHSFPADSSLFKGCQPQHLRFFPKGSWFLDGPNEYPLGVSRIALAVLPWARIVQATTPGEHYILWAREFDARQLCMDTWSWQETFAVYGPPDTVTTESSQTNDLAYSYSKYGPNPRVCHTTPFSSNTRFEQDQAIESAILDPSAPWYRLQQVPQIDDIFAIRAPGVTSSCVVPASPYSLQRLSEKMLENGIDRLERFYGAYLGCARMFHVPISSLSEIPIIRMLSLRGAFIFPRSLADGGLLATILTVLEGQDMIRFAAVEELEKLMLARQFRSRLWLPTHLEYSSVDAVVVSEDEAVWIIQIVTGSKHGISARALDALSQVLPNADVRHPWSVLFVDCEGDEDFVHQKVYGTNSEGWEEKLQYFKADVDRNGIDII